MRKSYLLLLLLPPVLLLLFHHADLGSRSPASNIVKPGPQYEAPISAARVEDHLAHSGGSSHEDDVPSSVNSAPADDVSGGSGREDDRAASNSGGSSHEDDVPSFVNSTPADDVSGGSGREDDSAASAALNSGGSGRERSDSKHAVEAFCSASRDGTVASFKFAYCIGGGGLYKCPYDLRRAVCGLVCTGSPQPYHTDPRHPFEICRCICQYEYVVRECSPLYVNSDGRVMIDLETQFDDANCLEDKTLLSSCLMFMAVRPRNITVSRLLSYECCDGVKKLMARASAVHCLCYIYVRSQLFDVPINASLLTEVLISCAPGPKVEHTVGYLMWFCGDSGPVQKQIIDAGNKNATSLKSIGQCLEKWRTTYCECLTFIKGADIEPSKPCCKAANISEAAELVEGPCLYKMLDNHSCQEGKLGALSCLWEAFYLCRVRGQLCGSKRWGLNGDPKSSWSSLLWAAVCALLIWYHVISAWVMLLYIVVLLGCFILFFMLLWCTGWLFNKIYLFLLSTYLGVWLPAVTAYVAPYVTKVTRWLVGGLGPFVALWMTGFVAPERWVLLINHLYLLVRNLGVSGSLAPWCTPDCKATNSSSLPY